MPARAPHLQVHKGSQQPGPQQALAGAAHAAIEAAVHREALLGRADAHGRRVALLLLDRRMRPAAPQGDATRAGLP